MLKSFFSNPYAEAIIAGLMWSASSVTVKLLHLPPETFAFFRSAVPVVLLLCYFWYAKIHFLHGNLKIMGVASLLNAVRIYLFMLGFLYCDISSGIILLFTWPAFAALYAALFLKEKTSIKKAGLIALAFFGMVFIYADTTLSFSASELFGMAALTLNSAVYAVTVIIYKKEIHNYSGWETIFYQNVLAAIIFAPFLFIHPAPAVWQTVSATAYGAVVGLIAFGFFFSALKKLDTATVSMLVYTEAVGAVILAMLLFDEKLTWTMLVGAAMIVTANVVLIRFKKYID